jgi:site-specific DNA-methyltransferase (adenine-specific)
MINKGMMSSNTDQWATPLDFFKKLDAEFYFDVDVCADADNAKCPVFFSKAENGLAQNWREFSCCWMNPPYGQEIGAWVKKAAESETEVVGLLPARTDTRWFHDHIYGKAEIRFIKGRLKFGDAKNSAPFPSMVVVWNRGANDLKELV